MPKIYTYLRVPVVRDLPILAPVAAPVPVLILSFFSFPFSSMFPFSSSFPSSFLFPCPPSPLFPSLCTPSHFWGPFFPRYHIVGQAPDLTSEAAGYLQATVFIYRHDAACLMAAPELLLWFSDVVIPELPPPYILVPVSVCSPVPVPVPVFVSAATFVYIHAPAPVPVPALCFFSRLCSCSRSRLVPVIMAVLNCLPVPVLYLTSIGYASSSVSSAHIGIGPCEQNYWVRASVTPCLQI